MCAAHAIACCGVALTVALIAGDGATRRRPEDGVYLNVGISLVLIALSYLGWQVCHYMTQPLIELYGDCMLVLKVS
jgi:hypothetical protein